MAVLTDPKEIETKSFQIVDKHLAGIKLPQHQKEVMKRVLHATSDLNYIEDIIFHPKAIRNALTAIRRGENVIVDASMVKAGINKKLLSTFGGKVVCLINRKDVARQASRLNITRATLAMRKASKSMEGGIVAIGNAPTALFEVCDLVNIGKARPALIIGLPVGFVGAKEAKKKLRNLKIPYITNRSRYGGSSAAASCVNALLKIANRKVERGA
ncbi:MAG: precorrin-8X methylmutase [Candidatus Omnitrophota bacterium]|nr:precorrin-8X methylmutase [Candidatus Omnitrophota bacterium]